jgi:hypothetical protein
VDADCGWKIIETALFQKHPVNTAEINKNYG